MRETRVTLPELALIAGTRVALGAGLGLLLANCFREEQRRAVGWTLLLFGAITTIPLAFEVLGGRLSVSVEEVSAPTASKPRAAAADHADQRFASVG